jgi:hypothetical protein
VIIDPTNHMVGGLHFGVNYKASNLLLDHGRINLRQTQIL